MQSLLIVELNVSLGWWGVCALDDGHRQLDGFNGVGRAGRHRIEQDRGQCGGLLTSYFIGMDNWWKRFWWPFHRLSV